MDKRRVWDGPFKDGDGESKGGMVLVRFELPAAVSARTASVCGDFNGWQADAHPLARLGDGGFRTALVLPAGERYRFRYLLDGQRWENDPAADDYVPNGLGADDSVVDLTDARSLPVIDDTRPTTASGTTASGTTAAMSPETGSQQVRLQRETWARLETEADARGIEPQDVIARMLEAATSADIWPSIEPRMQRRLLVE